MKLLEIVNMIDIKKYRFFDKNIGLGTIATSKAGASGNEKLAKELHKPVIKKIKRRRVYGRFKDNICVADLAEMRSLFPKNRNVKYVLWVIDVFSKYGWVKLLKDKKGKTVYYAFIQIVDESNCNQLTADNFAARLKEINLVSKTDFDNKLISFNRKITSNKTLV